MNKTLELAYETAAGLPDAEQERWGREWLQDLRLAKSEQSLSEHGGIPLNKAIEKAREAIIKRNGV